MTGKKGLSMAGLPWIAAMAFFMQALDATILNTALPAIAHSLGHSPLAMQSAIISYTLTVAMLIPVSGWLADRFGTRKVFIVAVSLFTLGSLACALSTSLPELVVFRVIQGIGGAMMMPVARLALLRAYPRSELLPVLNFVTMPGLVGPILGPVLGGVLVTWASWHWIFLINIPIGIIGILYARKYMPDFTTPRRRFDTSGFVLFGLSLVLFSSGIELFGEKIVASWMALSVIALSVVLMLAYIRHARRHPTPLISLSLFKTHTFSVGIAGNLATRLGTGCVPFLMPLMLQVGFGYPADGHWLDYRQVDRHADPALVWLSQNVGWSHHLYWFDDRAVCVAVAGNAAVAATTAAICAGDGDVHAVHLDEHHYASRFNR